MFIIQGGKEETMVGIDLSGRVALVVGVANKHSIAWAIAQKLAEAGCQIILTYQNERFEKSVKELAGQINCPLTIECDVTNSEQVLAVFEAVRTEVGFLDFLIHSLAFAPAQEWESSFLETSRSGFLKAIEISVYSLIQLSGEFVKISRPGGSIITLTFQASERVFPVYKVMGPAKAALENIVKYLARELGERGIRVNAISAGPISTLAARGIPGFIPGRQDWRERAPLKEDISQGDVANTALFLCSGLSKVITGEIIHVDAGYHIMGT